MNLPLTNSRVVNRYLANYAERELLQLHDFPEDLHFQHCLVIPAYNEAADYFTRLQLGPLHNQNALCITVINQPDTDSDTHLNEQLMHHLRLSGNIIWRSANMCLLQYGGSTNYWLAIDRFSSDQHSDRRIPAKEGVGLARKIGCDLATALIARSQIASSWIHSSDADAFLPKEYFHLPEAHHYSAAIYQFKHQNDGSAVGRATALYEQTLHYYVAGLKWAESPYAYHTIGSILAINAGSYCEVRGFPRRSGGEDFYLLNKLAKVGRIYQSDCIVRIKARKSDRVPFGTGPAVAAIMQKNIPEEDLNSYNPEVFICLKEWLTHIPKIWLMIQADDDPLAALSQPTRDAIGAVGWATIARHLDKQAKSQSDSDSALHNWFDAFRTLKFVHYLQKHYYPAMAFKTCLAQAEFTHTAS